MKKIKCDICGNFFLNKNHLEKHNISDINEKYYKLFFDQHKYDIDNVISDYQKGFSILDIKNKFNYSIIDIQKILDYKKINKRTCKDSKHTEKYLKKYKTSIIKKYGVDNISKLNITKEKKKSTMQKNYGRINNFCNTDIQKYAHSKIDYELAYRLNLDSIIKKYGVDNVSKIDFVRNKISSYQKDRISKMTEEERKELTKICRTYIKYKKISKLELRIQSILNDFNISYNCNYFIYGFYVDLIFNKNILEIMGDFWHGNPNKYNSGSFINLPGGKVKVDDLWNKDEIKKNKLERKGYKMYYLWESDINKMTDIDLINYITPLLL